MVEYVITQRKHTRSFKYNLISMGRRSQHLINLRSIAYCITSICFDQRINNERDQIIKPMMLKNVLKIMFIL